MFWNNIFREKKLAFEQMALARNNCQENVDQAASISEAEVTGELLWVKLHDNVSVSLLADSDENGGTLIIELNHNIATTKSFHPSTNKFIPLLFSLTRSNISIIQSSQAILHQKKV